MNTNTMNSEQTYIIIVVVVKYLDPSSLTVLLPISNFHFECCFQLIMVSVADDLCPAANVRDAVANSPPGKGAEIALACMNAAMRKCNPNATDKIAAYKPLVNDPFCTQKLNEKDFNFAGQVQGYIDDY